MTLLIEHSADAVAFRWSTPVKGLLELGFSWPMPEERKATLTADLKQLVRRKAISPAFAEGIIQHLRQGA